jgi:primase-polymerase (primpol)-like protein
MNGWLPVHADAIPAELRALPWVLWRAEPRAGDKPAKVPYRIAEPSRRASSTDPATWGSFEDAVEAHLSLVELPPIRPAARLPASA